ncbi:MAG: TIGR00269 family protein [Acidilobus sp.]
MQRLCDRCGMRPAAVFQPHSGKALCSECFFDDITARVKREVERWRMIEPGDVVLLALSGGKDGYTLLDVMSRIYKPDRLIGLNIVEGIHGYNKEEDAGYLVKTAKELGVDVIVTSIKEYVGFSVDEIMAKARDASSRISACTYCGISRRRIMNYYARELGVNKLATAHNLDDESQTAVINILRGDLQSLLRQHPLAELVKDPMLIRRIKPLRKIYEWETATFTMLKGYHIQETECPYIYQLPTLRAKVRRELYKYESEHPGSLLAFMESLDRLLEPLASKATPKSDLGRCVRCGEPTANGKALCKLCELLEGVGITRPLYAVRKLKVVAR